MALLVVVGYEQEKSGSMKKNFYLAACSLLLSLTGFSQTTTTNPIDAEFTDLIENSNSFKGYKVVDQAELTALQDKTANYTEELKQEIMTYQLSLQTQKDTIRKLKTNLAKLESQLAEVTAEKDEISFLGLPFSKANFKGTMWGIVGVLVLALALFIVRFKSSNARTREIRQKLQETEKEFDAYRAKALEKEQRMGRMLQDERNKHMKVAK